MSEISRRNFVKGASLGIGATAVFGTAAISKGIEPIRRQSGNQGSFEFNHGVASGDPLQDQLIIWTRLSPTGGLSRGRFKVQVGFEVATDPGFSDVVRSGTTLTDNSRDYTVKVDLVGLQPATDYYYRFIVQSLVSPVGRGRTLPTGNVSQVKLAVMSCSNYPAGYFNVYEDASLIPELDAVCHLGDYIYEYGPGGYATQMASQIGRDFIPGNDLEIITLRQYRTRYRQYRTDLGLQNLHASAPFICVWDDHEVANDAWREGAENHNPGEGEFSRRKQAAIRAYYEWMPIRPPGAQLASEIIYRKFDFGDLVSLHMLDTRIIGRDEQLDYADYIDNNGIFDAARFTADVTNSDRTLLGLDQLSWLLTGLTTSNATWQVLGQQVLMGRMNIPVELLAGLANPSADLLVLIAELASIKARIQAGDPTVTAQERARVENVAPYNLDAWDGYFFEREAIFETVATADKNLIALAGDTHNAWANDLRSLTGVPIGVEFATASVSSPGLGEILGITPPLAPQAEGAITLLIDDLRYANITDRGYMIVTFTPTEATAEWTFVDNILSTAYGQIPGRARALKCQPGPTGRKLEEV